MDTRYTVEQAELQRSAQQLARELGPATVADLDDGARRERLERAVRDAGWLELRDDAGDGTPLASGVEAAIVAEALGARVADCAFTGPLLAADLARRVGVGIEPGTTIACDTALLGTGFGVAVDAAGATLAIGASGGRLARARLDEGRVATDLTRSIADLGPTTLGTSGLSEEDLAAFQAFGLALTTADLVGVMRGVIGITVEYAKERKQYGVAVGSFQAVQHLLADAAALLDGSQSVALHAAWAVDSLEPSAALEAGRVAKAYCARAARTICETAVQVHGGIGNTWECIVHVYLRRALLSTQWFGDDGVQLRELARTRLAVA